MSSVNTNKEEKAKENKTTKRKKANLNKLKNIFDIVFLSILFLSVSFALFPLGSSLRANLAYPSIIIALVFYISFIIMVIASIFLHKFSSKIDDKSYRIFMRTKLGAIFNILFVLLIIADIIFNFVYNVNDYINFATLGLTLFTAFAGILFNSRSYTILNPVSTKKEDKSTSDAKKEDSSKEDDSKNDNSKKDDEKESALNE